MVVTSAARLGEASISPGEGAATGREFWQVFFRGLEATLAAAAASADADESADLPGLELWSAATRRREHLLAQVRRLQAHLFASRDAWSICTPSRHQLLEAWASLTEAWQHCADQALDGRELRPAFEFVKGLASAAGFQLQPLARLLEDHGRQLDEMQVLLEGLWNNPGDVYENWRPLVQDAPERRIVGVQLEERFLQAASQLERLQALALALRPALAPLAAEGLLTEAEDPLGFAAAQPVTTSVRLATARVVLRSEPAELGARFRSRVVQVFDELSREKRRQLRLLRSEPSARGWRALRGETRFADIEQLTAALRRDPLLATTGAFRAACHLLGLVALAGAAVAASHGAIVPVVVTVTMWIALMLLAAWSLRTSERFRHRLGEHLREVEERLTTLERRLHEDLARDGAP